MGALQRDEISGRGPIGQLAECDLDMKKRLASDT